MSGRSSIHTQAGRSTRLGSNHCRHTPVQCGPRLPGLRGASRQPHPRPHHPGASLLSSPWPIHPLVLYLMSGREAAPALMPRDLGMGLPGHHAVQIQGLPFSHMGGGGLDADGLGATGSWANRWSPGHSSSLQVPLPIPLSSPSPGWWLYSR